jgi:tetratricopeptide (TPR) repeat protein
LTKIASWDGEAGVNAVFVHGLGGHAIDTWQRDGDDTTFWPAWLSRDIPGLTAWTLAYDAPPSNWRGADMALQDRATNVLERLLGEPELRGRPLVFICHSLGGLVVKQVIRAAAGRRAYSAADAAFLDTVKGVVFIATPHTGSLHATLLDRLRLIAWPSASALDLVKNNANLRNLNVWYRNNWSLRIRHKVFFEKRGTTAGVIVADDSADPGLLHVDPVAVDADHIDICKPADEGDLVYARTRDFIVEEIVPGETSGADFGSLRRLGLPALPRSRSRNIAPIAVRLAVLLIVGLIGFKGVQALLFPPDLLKSYRDGLATRERLAQSDPGNAGWQRDLSISYERIGDVQVAQGNLADALRSFRDGLAIIERLAQSDTGNADWQRDLSVSYVKIGDVQVAQGNLVDALKSFRDGLAISERLARSDPGNADWQRDLLISYNKIGDMQVAQGNLADALKSYRDGLAIAAQLVQSDPGNAGWQRDLSVSNERLGDVNLAQGNLSAAVEQYRASLARMIPIRDADPSNMDLQGFTSVTYNKIGNVQVAQDNLADALKSFRDGLAISERLARSNPRNAGWQQNLSVSYVKIGNVQVAQGNLAEALKSYRDGLAIIGRLAQSDPGNASWQRNLSVSYVKIGDVLKAQGNLPDALKSFRDGHDIFKRLAQSDSGSAGWQRDLLVFYNKIGDVQVAQGNLADALKSFRDGLAIIDRLAQSDPSNAVWQFDLVTSHWRLAANGDDAPRRWAFIVATLRKLKEENRLAPVQEKWLPEAEAQLARTR